MTDSVGKCCHLKLMWKLVNVKSKIPCSCSLFIAASFKKKEKKSYMYKEFLPDRVGGVGQHPGRAVDFRAMLAQLRQKGLKRRRGVVTGVLETVGFLTPSTVPYGSPIRFHWKNRVRPEEQPLPQCVHTSLALALPPWGPAVPSGPQWTCTPPKRKRDCSPKGRNYCKDLAL